MATDTQKSKRLLITSGIALALFGIIFPFFRWYVLMHATCAPSNDFCGVDGAMVIVFVSIPCFLLGLLSILRGLILTDQPRQRLYWPALGSLVCSLLAVVAHILLRTVPVTGKAAGYAWDVFILTLIISSLLSLMMAITALVATRDLGWSRGRLFSLLAFVASVLLLFWLLLSGPII
ncbi:hypothetical protein KDA_43750 [Dictyobacter alpinus]|uniref:Uncharacterized protein n=1 Tax=Dictyobacter alpinus TaxID=2014873 RepID=A0A402BBT4_9CHLR|nr:hypothetical protein [Dictyobacter alpinus]GCE28891.1 hypothetical protein KDA_43750 [Dictyobacter alpinus]